MYLRRDSYQSKSHKINKTACETRNWCNELPQNLNRKESISTFNCAFNWYLTLTIFIATLSFSILHPSGVWNSTWRLGGPTLAPFITRTTACITALDHSRCIWPRTGYACCISCTTLDDNVVVTSGVFLGHGLTNLMMTSSERTVVGSTRLQNRICHTQFYHSSGN